MIIRLGPRKDIAPASQPLISSGNDASLRLSLPERCSFMGRRAELAKLDEWVGLSPNKTPQRSIATLWGLAGAGKSQLASEFVKQQREKHPSYDIFWVTGTTREAFEQSILAVMKATSDSSAMSHGSENYDEYLSMLINSFFAELKSMTRTRWLLVIDGIPSDQALQQHIRTYLDQLSWGSIILTTRSTEVAYWYDGSMEIRGLCEADAVKLLHLGVDPSLRPDERDVTDLVKMLNCHPLSLRLAASVVSNHRLTVRQYVEKWRGRELSHDSTNIALLRSLELSFDELEQSNYMAANLLMLFGFLDHRDLWLDLCLNATDSLPEWLCGITCPTQFRGYYTSMRNSSFVESKPCGKQGGQVYEIHPAIHEFARFKAKKNEEGFVKAAMHLIAARVPRSTDKDFVDIVQRLGPHAEQCMIYMKQGRCGSSLDLLELEQFGNLFRHLGRYKEATELYEGIRNIVGSEETPDEFTVGMMVGIENNLGLIYHAQRKYSLALAAYDRSLSRRSCLESQDPKALEMTRYNKGRAWLMLGNLDMALQNLLAAASHFSTLPSASNTSSNSGNSTREYGHEARRKIYFRILNDVGEVFLRKRDVEKAEQSFAAAFQGHKTHLHEMHPATFAVRLNMGRACVERCRFSAANKIFEYAVATYTDWWGRRHSETMRAVGGLAESHLRHAEMKRLMGDGGEWELDMAGELWAEILSFQEDIFGVGSEAAGFARAKVQQVQTLRTVEQEDPCRVYYSSRDG